MSQELLYTSAPHGLKPGSRGFCTVLSTQGMAAPVANALEGLSGYRPVFPPGDERSDLNPINWSHVTLPIAGRTWHVLSRVAEYGLDYSQRTNKLAHHVLLDSSELITAGPVELLANRDFMRSDWDEEPRLVPAKVVPKIPPHPRGVCEAWKELTGDGGWGGVLAEAFLRDPERPVILLYAPGQDMLPLIGEALSLIPADRRWELTFSTYFTGLPQGVSCNWRCMLSDSPEAQQSLRLIRALRLDLTAPDQLGTPSGGDLVADARGVPRAKPTPRTVPPALPKDRVGDQSSTHPNDQRTLPVADNASDRVDDHPDDDRPSGDVPPLPGSHVYEIHESLRPRTRRPRDFPALSAGQKFNQRRTIAIVAAGFGLVVVLVAGLGYSLVRSLRSPPDTLVVANQDSDPRPAPIELAPTEPDDVPAAERKEEQTADAVVESKPKDLPTETASEVASADAAPAAAAEPAAPQAEAVARNPGLSPPDSPKTELRPELPPGPKKADLSSWKKGAITKLGELFVVESPVREMRLWSPKSMFLGLKKVGKSKYMLTEKSASFELGSIYWQAAKPEGDVFGPQEFILNLKAGEGINKFKRLKWCEIEIDNPTTKASTQVFHPFPISRKQNEKRTDALPGKVGAWGVQWTLNIESDSAHLPEFLADKITLAVGDKQFEFKSSERNPTSDSQQQIKLKSEEFINFMTADSPEKKGKNPADSLVLQLVARVESKDHETPGPVVINVTLEGLQKVIDGVVAQRRLDANEVVKLFKKLEPNTAGSGSSNRKVPAPLNHTNHKKYLEDAISDVTRSIREVETSVLPPQVKSQMGMSLAAEKNKFEDLLKTEESRTKVESVLDSLSIQSADVFYQLTSSSDGTLRPVYLFENSK